MKFEELITLLVDYKNEDMIIEANKVKKVLSRNEDGSIKSFENIIDIHIKGKTKHLVCKPINIKLY